MDAQSPGQLRNPVPANFVGKNFQKGSSGNPGGRAPSAAHRKVVEDLIAELGCEPSASQLVIINEIARATTGRHYKYAKTPAATVARLMKQLGLPRQSAKLKFKPAPRSSIHNILEGRR